MVSGQTFQFLGLDTCRDLLMRRLFSIAIFLAMASLAASAQLVPPLTVGIGALNVQTIFSSERPFACVEAYATPIMNGDYGQMINAADQAQSLTTASTVKICSPGSHPVSTPIVFDRPIHFEMTGSKLIPSSSMGSAPIVLTNATVTAGSEVLTVSSSSRFSIGQSIGGLGITYGSYIAALGPGTISISLPPSLTLLVQEASSTTLTAMGSLAGFAVGQTISGPGIPGSTTITAVNIMANPQTLTISNAATTTTQSPVSISVSSGTWTVPTLTAVTAVPVITWMWNQSALQNEFGQNIGGAMKDVWVSDATERGIPGLQGVKIYGWDGFDAFNTDIEFIDGSGLVLGGIAPYTTGGQGSVRESFFFDTKVRYSGDIPSSQPAVALMTPYISDGGDETNQIGFSSAQFVTNLGETLTIGTYNPNHRGTNGPRLIWFDNNSQLEGGQYIAGLAPKAQTEADTLHIIQADDIYFIGSELATAAFGKSVVRIDTANTLSILGCKLLNAAGSANYTVNVTNGSKAVSRLSGGKFQTDGSWNGIAIDVNRGASTVYLDPSNGVPSTTTLKLAANYTGTTGRATFSMPTLGYVINLAGTINNLQVKGGELSAQAVPIPSVGSVLTAYVGAPIASFYGELQSPQTTNGWAQMQYTAINPFTNAFQPLETLLAPNQGNGDCTQRFNGVSLSANNSVVEEFCYTSSGSASNYGFFTLYGQSTGCSISGSGTWSCNVIQSNGKRLNPVLTGTTGTITGTLLSASCGSGTVTVTGAMPGMIVGVSSTTGADVGGAFDLRASVTSPNTVTVYVCGTGTPASLAYNVRVIQ